MLFDLDTFVLSQRAELDPVTVRPIRQKTMEVSIALVQAEQRRILFSRRVLIKAQALLAAYQTTANENSLAEQHQTDSLSHIMNIPTDTLSHQVEAINEKLAQLDKDEHALNEFKQQLTAYNTNGLINSPYGRTMFLESNTSGKPYAWQVNKFYQAWKEQFEIEAKLNVSFSILPREQVNVLAMGVLIPAILAILLAPLHPGFLALLFVALLWGLLILPLGHLATPKEARYVKDPSPLIDEETLKKEMDDALKLPDVSHSLLEPQSFFRNTNIEDEANKIATDVLNTKMSAN